MSVVCDRQQKLVVCSEAATELEGNFDSFCRMLAGDWTLGGVFFGSRKQIGRREAPGPADDGQ